MRIFRLKSTDQKVCKVTGAGSVTARFDGRGVSSPPSSASSSGKPTNTDIYGCTAVIPSITPLVACLLRTDWAPFRTLYENGLPVSSMGMTILCMFPAPLRILCLNPQVFAARQVAKSSRKPIL